MGTYDKKFEALPSFKRACLYADLGSKGYRFFWLKSRRFVQTGSLWRIMLCRRFESKQPPSHQRKRKEFATNRSTFFWLENELPIIQLSHSILLCQPSSSLRTMFLYPLRHSKPYSRTFLGPSVYLALRLTNFVLQISRCLNPFLSRRLFVFAST